MNLLDNELVKKYFGCGKCVHCYTGHMAKKVIDAMQQPILKGERYLKSDMEGGFCEIVCNDEQFMPFHGLCLRLPDKFQKPKECDHHAYEKHCTLCPYVEIKTDWYEMPDVTGRPKPAPAPEKCINCGKLKSEMGSTDYKWDKSGGVHTCIHFFKPSSGVEEKIREILRTWTPGSMEANSLACDLRALVALVRDEK